VAVCGGRESVELLLQAGVFPGAAAQKIQVGAPDMGVAMHDHFFQARRARQEGAFDADAIAGHAPHGKIRIHSTLALADDSTAEFLRSFVVSFFDAQEHADGVARADLGNIRIFRGGNGLNNFTHGTTSIQKIACCMKLAQENRLSKRLAARVGIITRSIYFGKKEKNNKTTGTKWFFTLTPLAVWMHNRSMLFTRTTYIGIDPTAGQVPFTYAVLEQDLRLLALGQGNLEDVLAYVGGQREAYVAVCAPRRPSQGVLERSDVRASLSPQPRPGRWSGFRLAEYQLRQHHIACPKTGSDEARCPGWMRMGFTLYRRLEALGYRACTPAPVDSSETQPPLLWLETYPHAIFCALLGRTPFPKETLEGRIQRQLVLFDQKLRIPDPMNIFEEITRHRLLQGILPLKDLYSPAELDALAGAFTAWMAGNHPDRLTLLGHADEGQIFLPVSVLPGLKH